MLLPDSFEIINYKNEIEVIPLFIGSLKDKKLDYDGRLGLSSLHCQRARCYNPNDDGYENSGALGITVNYSTREFVSWWLFKLKSFDSKWRTSTFRGDRPTCGRIDHSKSYSFDNIKMESMTVNCIERCQRLGTPKPKKPVQQLKNGCVIAEFDSVTNAAKSLGFDRNFIKDTCSGRHKTAYGFIWRFVTDSDKI